MRSILLIDKRNTFISDIQTRMLLENYDFEICSGISETDSLMTTIQNFHPNEIYVADNIIESQRDWDFSNISVKSYATSPEGEAALLTKKVTYAGMIKDTSDLINIIENNSIYENKQKSEVNTNMSMNTNQTMEHIPIDSPQNVNTSQMVNIPPQTYPQQMQQMTPENMQQMMQMFQMFQMMPNMGNMQPSQQVYPQMQQPFMNQMPQTPSQTAVQQISQPPMSNVYPQTNTTNNLSESTQTEAATVKIQQNIQQSESVKAEEQVNHDIERGSHDTKVITFFSSKGGAGTTSIAESVAIQLSRTPHDRGYYKVCLVDFDIDFGDVMADLQLDVTAENKNVSAWGRNIRKQVETIVSTKNIEDPNLLTDTIIETAKNIKFSKDEIMDFMQKYENTGLYVLPAPITHKDSMEFEGFEFSTILHNLKESKEFDYIIIDTKSDSRDATYCALDIADTVYLVFTQDIACINSNDSFYQALKDVNFDISKFQYVINRVRSQSETGLGTTDIEGVIPYKCAGHMHETNAMTKARNTAVPLVFQANNEFTKDVTLLTSSITGNPVINTKKRGFFKK